MINSKRNFRGIPGPLHLTDFMRRFLQSLDHSGSIPVSARSRGFVKALPPPELMNFTITFANDWPSVVTCPVTVLNLEPSTRFLRYPKRPEIGADVAGQQLRIVA